MHYCTLTSDSVYHLPGDPGAEGFGGLWGHGHGEVAWLDLVWVMPAIWGGHASQSHPILSRCRISLGGDLISYILSITCTNHTLVLGGHV